MKGEDEMAQGAEAAQRSGLSDPAGNAGEAKEQAQAKAKEVAGKAQDQMGRAADRAQGRLREQVDARSTQAGERVHSVAGDAHSVAEELRKQGKDAPARYAEQAADRAERVGDWLRDSDGDRILADVEDFARRNPMALVAGGLAVGFMAARLLKASSRERYQRAGADPARVGGGRSTPSL
jgi:ElaB/YqjD/DUF883 family membrane-anchored ribosome-binding protein